MKIVKYRENAESVGDAKWLTNLDEMVILFFKKSKQEVTLPYCIFISQEQKSLCTKKRKKKNTQAEKQNRFHP